MHPPHPRPNYKSNVTFEKCYILVIFHQEYQCLRAATVRQKLMIGCQMARIPDIYGNFSAVRKQITFCLTIAVLGHWSFWWNVYDHCPKCKNRFKVKFVLNTGVFGPKYKVIINSMKVGLCSHAGISATSVLPILEYTSNNRSYALIYNHSTGRSVAYEFLASQWV